MGGDAMLVCPETYAMHSAPQVMLPSLTLCSRTLVRGLAVLSLLRGSVCLRFMCHMSDL